MATSSERIEFRFKSNVVFHGLASAENVVYFGNHIGAKCERCGAFGRTSTGHTFCAHVACPIALIEFKRRKRKRTSNLERIYVPRLARRGPEAAPS